MRVPVNPPHTNQSSNPKSEPCNNSNTNSHSRNIGLHSPSMCYEPTSVLDLRRSPSPVAGKPTKVSAISDVLSHQPNDPLELDELQALHNFDWDSVMKDLGLPDESVPVLKTVTPPFNSSEPQIPHLPMFPQPQPFDPTQLVQSDFNLSELYSDHNLAQNLNSFDLAVDIHHGGNWNVGFDFIEDLIRAADCFDSDNLQLAHVILERLNQRLRSSPVGKPVGKGLRRAALYFKEALQSLLLNGSNRMTMTRMSNWSEIVQTIKAYRAFSNMSPIPMFSHFTTNQALLEALNGSNFIHIIDFDIGLGGQHASFMKELAEKAVALRVNPPVLRITAVVAEEYVTESRLITENLTQFAQELKIRFQIEFVSIHSFEMLSLKAIKFIDGEKTAVLLSPCILRRLDPTNRTAGFLADIRRLSPVVVVFVDSEGLGEAGAASFRRNFVSSLEFYSMMLESLDSSMSGGDFVPKIETFLLKPKIQLAVESAGRRGPAWREVFRGVGMRPVQLSEFAVFQAKLLLAKIQVSGFQVGKRQADPAELVLWWHERAMVATSAWRC
ncbi:hypothetical protein FEM48_Zijuj08G0104100 [Ziziphus jujuba var. spinosa]|uniref:Scarecrow-like protein 15 n=1 Tax=Ziziphus jujuba var. spinosa TaxID=714518 RepID=A0A978UYJ7_ZIZJJ|nr:hypothetical protein FEM48_Zijuj08G0104100 [Ziziphus jujuba var. spinosa]